jgi:hypothetical protein
MRKIPFAVGDVLNIKLRDDLFSIAQVSLPSYVTFFDIASKNGDWKDVDLSKTPILFCAVVATTRMKPLIVGKLASDRVKADTRQMERLFIKPGLNFSGGHAFRGGNLIEVDDRGETTQRPIIKKGLTAEADSELILKYELTNMWNDPELLRDRLIRYFDDGINWDRHKEQIFPGIKPPNKR